MHGYLAVLVVYLVPSILPAHSVTSGQTLLGSRLLANNNNKPIQNTAVGPTMAHIAAPGTRRQTGPGCECLCHTGHRTLLCTNVCGVWS